MLRRTNRRSSVTPQVETLEHRLPPGDALLGMLFLGGEENLEFQNSEFRIQNSESGCDSISILRPSSLESLSPDSEFGVQRSSFACVTADDGDAESVANCTQSVATWPGSGAAVSRYAPILRRYSQESVATWPVVSTPASDSAIPGHVPGQASFPNSSSGTPVRETPFRRPAGFETEFPGPAFPNRSSGTRDVDVGERYESLPLYFEQNVGQTHARVDFIARTGDYTAFITPTAAVFAVQNSESRIQNSESESEPRPLGSGLRDEPLADAHGSDNTASFGVAIHMEIAGGNSDAQASGVSPLSGKVNYMRGNAQWRTNVSTFGAVQYDDVYPGIDLVYYGKDQQLEYDFIVSPGADPNAIALNFAGADGAEINPHGDLVLHTAAGDLVQQKPYLYQEVNGTRQEVAGNFVLSTQYSSLVTFDIGAYDLTRPLVIDPLVMGYSTFLGGSGDVDYGGEIAVDSAGSAYQVGSTFAPNFPATPGAFDTTHNGSFDAYIAKLNPAGSALEYATFLGGSGSDSGVALTLDDGGNVYLAGYSGSMDFPTTLGAFDTSYNGGFGDVFVAKLSADGGNLDYATFLGGFSQDYVSGIEVDENGHAYVAGDTLSSDFPTTPGALDTTLSGAVDGFVVKLNAGGGSLGYATFLGGSDHETATAMAMDRAGNVYVTGQTLSNDFPATAGAFDTTHSAGSAGFVAKLNPNGSSLVYATFLGQAGDDFGLGIAIDGSGNAFVIGGTGGAFPITSGAFDTTYNGGTYDAFVTKLNASGSGLIYSTYLGGSTTDSVTGIAIDRNGNAFVIGTTNSTNFPTTSGAFDTTHNGGANDGFVTKLNPNGTALGYSTFLGGMGWDTPNGIAVDTTGSVYVSGFTDSSNFPTTPGAFKRRNRGTNDAFVTKLAEV